MPRPVFRQSRRHRRAVALLLVMIAVIVTGVVAFSYVGTQSTSIGVAQNINKLARARYIAETGLEVAIAAVRDNGSWRSQRPNGTWLSNQSLAGGTYTIIGQDGLDTTGDGVPDGDGSLSDDATDPVTLTVTGTYGGVTYQVRATLGPEGSGAILAYTQAGQSNPRYRVLSGTSWGNEVNASSTSGEQDWIVLRRSPDEEVDHLSAMAALNHNKRLTVQTWDGEAWGSVAQMTADAGLESSRVFDLAYEQTSASLLCAYRAGSNASLRFRTYAAGAWSSESTYALNAVAPYWIRLVPKPNSDQMLIGGCAPGDTAVAVWNGSAFGNKQTLTVSGLSYVEQTFDMAYETLSGDGMVVHAAAGSSNPRYRIWNGTSWSAQANVPALDDVPHFIRLASDPASDRIIMAAVDDKKRLSVNVWSGSAWGSNLVIENNLEQHDRRMFDVAFEKGGTRALVLYQKNSAQVFYRVWDGSNWSAQTTAGDLGGDKAQIIQAVTGGASGEVFVTVLDSGNRVKAALWNGSSFTAFNTVESTSSGSTTKESFMAVAYGSGGSEYVVDRR